MLFNKDKFEYVDHYIKDSDDPDDLGVREIIAIAHYNGKTYKGHARCHPDDTFDPTIGEEIASRRCDLFIRRARLGDRNEAYGKALDDLHKAETIADLAESKFAQAATDLAEAQEQYDNYITWLENR